MLHLLAFRMQRDVCAFELQSMRAAASSCQQFVSFSSHRGADPAESAGSQRLSRPGGRKRRTRVQTHRPQVSSITVAERNSSVCPHGNNVSQTETDPSSTVKLSKSSSRLLFSFKVCFQLQFHWIYSFKTKTVGVNRLKQEKSGLYSLNLYNYLVYLYCYIE